MTKLQLNKASKAIIAIALLFAMVFGWIGSGFVVDSGIAEVLAASVADEPNNAERSVYGVHGVHVHNVHNVRLNASAAPVDCAYTQPVENAHTNAFEIQTGCQLILSEGEPIIFDGLTLLAKDELLTLIEIAPTHQETRSATTFTNRRLTDTELYAWIEEYKSLGLNAFELEVIMLINEIRISYGLEPWAISMELSMAARFHSQDMFDLEFMSHWGPINGGPTDRAIMFGHVNRNGSFGTFENIGGARNGRRTPQAQVDAWMNSPGHRAALLRDWHISIGVGRVGGHTTAKFGS